MANKSTGSGKSKRSITGSGQRQPDKLVVPKINPKPPPQKPK